jgi:curved DNA-binding protein CbpA
MNPYKILGIKPGATAEEIKTAYKKMAQKNHPDREGGDEGLMKEIVAAYDMLKDPSSEDHYDRRIDHKLEDLFKAIIAHDAFNGDIVSSGFSQIRDLISRIEHRNKTLKFSIQRFEKFKNRLTVEKGANLFENLIVIQLDTWKAELEANDEELEIIDLVSERLSNYSDTRGGSPERAIGNYINTSRMGGFDLS